MQLTKVHTMLNITMRIAVFYNNSLLRNLSVNTLFERSNENQTKPNKKLIYQTKIQEYC